MGSVLDCVRINNRRAYGGAKIRPGPKHLDSTGCRSKREKSKDPYCRSAVTAGEGVLERVWGGMLVSPAVVIPSSDLDQVEGGWAPR